MNDDALTRLEAMLVSLRDQVDALTERVESRLADQHLALARLRMDLARVTSGVVQPAPPGTPFSSPPRR